ncbi:MAG: efflux RND transporter permease subunit [Bacteroidales bacterium]|nr:efflux RND transporter permease subunit [Bacteroidales bacterium]
MNIKNFIDRPLLSIVINVMVVAVGIIALTRLPIEKFPDIAPPTVYLWASYPGASAETVQKSVVAPLEQAINGVDNMMYMTSSASNGSASISICFKQGTNADMAAVNVQNRVVQAQAQLPAEVLKMGVAVEKQQPGQLRILALESPGGTYDENFLSNYFYNNLRPAILRIQGVGKCEVWGGQYALRIWLRPEAMARYGIVPSDITTLLEEQNVEASIGSIGENIPGTFQYTLRYTGRKQDVSEFENLILRSNQTGEELRLKDVADLELGQSDYAYSNRINGHPGVMGSVSQVAGSNATSINQDIDKLIKEVEQTMPKDIRIVTFDNTNDFLFASIHEVVFTLLLAIVLVLVVVYLFVQDFRATLIPALGIIVSLIGTFAFMAVAGFSINMLTLFALVLVIGTVVDDSIVVVEAVQARISLTPSPSPKGEGSDKPRGDNTAVKLTAPPSSRRGVGGETVDAMSSITSALFTSTLIFMVIFIPVSFVSGTSGTFYKQFGLTMAVAVGISLLYALTLAPALCALILKRNNDSKKGLSQRVRRIYNASFHALLGRYTKVAMQPMRQKWLAAAGVTGALALTALLLNTVPTGFVPDEDMGSLMIDVSAPSGYTMAKTEEVMNRLTDQIQQLPEVESVGSVVGFGGANKGMVQVQLRQWSQRTGSDHTSWAVSERINEILAGEHEAESFAMSPGMIDGYGRGGGFEVSVTNKNGQDLRTFFDITERFVEALNRRPEISDAYSGYAIDYPQYRVDVDASRCKKLGVSPSTMLNELGAFLGSSYVSNFNKYNQVYQVTMQLRPTDRADLHSLDRLFIRSADGTMLSASQFVTLRKEYMPQSLSRFNMMGSIGITGSVAQGSSTGDAIRAIREVAQKELPVGYGIEFGGITREESQTGSNIIVIFFICVFFVYLIMVALYESLFIPLAVILGVPFGLMGALLFAQLFGVENNIYLQVGLIMLIGLLCKTAVLLTEYATQCRQAGMSLKQSAFFAAKMRLRPILMTSLTMIFGMLPLMFASGAGANGSRTVGVGTVGGMLIGTLGLLFVVPALFVFFQTLQERFKPAEFQPSDDPLIIEEMKKIDEYTQMKKEKKYDE